MTCPAQQRFAAVDLNPCCSRFHTTGAAQVLALELGEYSLRVLVMSWARSISLATR